MRQMNAKGLFSGLSSICDLGPQSCRFSAATLYKFAKTTSTTPDVALEIAIGIANDPRMPRCTRKIYEYFGFKSYSAIDLHDPQSDLPFDLNYAASIGRTFDVITNFGTSEHIFSIGNTFITCHNLLRPGGLVLFCLPAAGAVAHGYYNIHPNLYSHIAEANNYYIESFYYIDDLYERDRVFDADPINADFDFEKLPINFRQIESLDNAWIQRRIFEQYLDNANSRDRRFWDKDDVGVQDHVYCAMRKIDDKPFVYPQQYVQSKFV